MLAKEDALHDAPGASHAPREIQVAVVVWEGLTNREIDRFIGTSEEVMKIQLRSTFDKPGVCRRLELDHGRGQRRRQELEGQARRAAVGFSSAAAAGWGFFATETFSPRGH